MDDLPSKLDRTAEPAWKGERVGFSNLDGRSVAVILRQGGKQFVFRGAGAFERDDALGNVLIITATNPQSVDPKLIISEQEWKGRIIPDLEHGCEFCIIPHG